MKLCIAFGSHVGYVDIAHLPLRKRVNFLTYRLYPLSIAGRPFITKSLYCDDTCLVILCIFDRQLYLEICLVDQKFLWAVPGIDPLPIDCHNRIPYVDIDTGQAEW